MDRMSINTRRIGWVVNLPEGEVYTVQPITARASGTLNDCDYSHDLTDNVTVRIADDGKFAEDVTPYAEYLYIVPAMTAAGATLFALVFFGIFGIRIGLVAFFDRGRPKGDRKRK